MSSDLKSLIEFQTKLQGVANSVSKDMVSALDASDRELLETIQKGLAKPFTGKSLKESYERLQKICEQVTSIRKKAIENAKIVMKKNGEKIADKLSAQACENLKKSTKKKIKPVPKKKLDDIIKYQPFQGRTIEDWFQSWTESDKNRIVSAIQQAVNEGITLQKAINLIRGTINPNTGKREGGVLDVSRSSASMIARTITNGVANEARLATLDENDDVIDGYQFLATLDGRTSFICASLDGKIWRKDEREQVKRPPLHPNCRSTLIPYIELRDKDGNIIEDEDSRPMANADFDQYAREQYEKKYPGKKFSDLAQTTRDNYYYKAQNQYEKETGKPAYSQTSGKTTFKDYFENQPDDFKRSWLGEKRFELYKDGKLKFDKLVKPDSGYVVPLSELDPKDEPKE